MPKFWKSVLLTKNTQRYFMDPIEQKGSVAKFQLGVFDC